MTFDYDWHVPVDRLERYAAGAAGPIEQDSIEAHLLVCDHCRANLAAARPAVAPAHDAMLRAITDRIDQPRRRFHRSTGALQVSFASPVLVGTSALLAMALLVAVGVVAAIEPPFSIAVLMALAPIAPVVAAVVGFWPTTDPAGAISDATALAGGRLPFLRALFATAVSAAAGLISSAFTPLGWSDAACVARSRIRVRRDRHRGRDMDEPAASRSGRRRRLVRDLHAVGPRTPLPRHRRRHR